MSCMFLHNENAKIAFIGSWPTEADVKNDSVLQGQVGVEFSRMLAQAKILPSDYSFFNLLPSAPYRGDIANICTDKKTAGKDYPYSPYELGKYVKLSVISHFENFKSELALAGFNLIVPLGKFACWAMLNESKLSKHRGTTIEIPLGTKLVKALPTYHPSDIIRDWALRPIAVSDMEKIRDESKFPELRRTVRIISIAETIEDIEKYFREYLQNAKEISYDIETGKGMIKCIAFSPNPIQALVIPFTHETSVKSWWPDAQSEVSAWNWVKRILALPSDKIAQNGLYDLQWLWRKMGIATLGELHDTMLLHHALYPELEKSLGFLGSIYCNESSWKNLRTKAASETTKSDDE